MSESLSSQSTTQKIKPLYNMNKRNKYRLVLIASSVFGLTSFWTSIRHCSWDTSRTKPSYAFKSFSFRTIYCYIQTGPILHESLPHRGLDISSSHFSLCEATYFKIYINTMCDTTSNFRAHHAHQCYCSVMLASFFTLN